MRVKDVGVHTQRHIVIYIYIYTLIHASMHQLHMYVSYPAGYWPRRSVIGRSCNQGRWCLCKSPCAVSQWRNFSICAFF